MKKDATDRWLRGGVLLSFLLAATSLALMLSTAAGFSFSSGRTKTSSPAAPVPQPGRLLGQGADAGPSSPDPLPLEPPFAAWLSHGGSQPGDATAPLPIDAQTHWLGKSDARVTLLLFGDAECPLTRRRVSEALRELARGDKDFRFVFCHRLTGTHPDAPRVARALERRALLRGEQAFWATLWEIVEHPDRPGAAAFDPRDLASNNRQREIERRILRDDGFALRFTVRDTPTLFVNGLRFAGDGPSFQLWAMVENEGLQVQALSQTPSAATYAARVRHHLLGLD